MPELDLRDKWLLLADATNARELLAPLERLLAELQQSEGRPSANEAMLFLGQALVILTTRVRAIEEGRMEANR